MSPGAAGTSARHECPRHRGAGSQPAASALMRTPVTSNVYPDYQTRAALSAASTRASRKGTRRRRTPVASWIAFATAAMSGLHAVSPPPYGGRSGPVRVRISIQQHYVNPRRSVGMPKARMRNPVHARDLFRIELDLLMQRAAQRMQHRALDGVAQRLRVDHQPAVVRTNQPL